jgi:uncharacterized protein YndB with AHSA1/START domain
VISRTFPAPREMVFEAWSSADHMKRWFSPATYTVPEAEVDFRPGGVIAICMRSPEGNDFWSKGTYDEIFPPERLAFTFRVTVGGEQKFSARTVVTFEADHAGTRLTVRQDYELFDPAFITSIEGAPEGWRTTLDKLGREIARLRDKQSRSVVHGSFSVERTYDAAPALVFRALTDPDAKARWFVGGEGYTTLERTMDVRPGGRERLSGRWASGLVSTFDAVYCDVVPDQRLVYVYEMYLDDRKISVSLATVELKPVGTGTRLLVTEHGAFLDGYEDGGAREHGTGMLLDRLGASLKG